MGDLPRSRREHCDGHSFQILADGGEMLQLAEEGCGRGSRLGVAFARGATLFYQPGNLGVKRVDDLGAHVSAAGGLDRAPSRAVALGVGVLQLFTKNPNRWADPEIRVPEAAAFRAACRRSRIRVAAAHDSYLINLASSDATLYARSYQAFCNELRRCRALGLRFLVSHPGHATDGDRVSGLDRNAAAVEQALEETGAPVTVLLETTAGGGSVLGSRFEELSHMIERLAGATRRRVGICLDTCHVWAAGYDLRRDYDGVIQAFADVLGLGRLRLMHLNDSVGALGSQRDRHAQIARGKLGAEPFRRVMNDQRLRSVPKVIETPKNGDPVAADRRNLARLRRYRQSGG